MIRDHLSRWLAETVGALIAEGALPRAEYAAPEIQDTRQPEYGDYATNWAMIESKRAGMNPRALAEMLAVRLAVRTEVVSAVEVAGPGFLNLRLQPAFAAGFLAKMVAKGPSGIARREAAHPQRINVEFVSVNPNGPITIGSGRGAAYGSTLCNVLQAAGNVVHREYYINDGVNSEQMRLFALSVQSFVQGNPFPERGYRGDYVSEVADQIKKVAGAATADTDWFQQQSQELMIEAQRTALTAFGVEFDTWFSEQSLHNSGQVAKELDVLLAAGVADDQPHRTKLKLAKGGKIDDVEIESQTSDEENADATGDSPTVWLRSTRFGDDMDRVLRRRDGRLTYIASDVAYHWDKFNRPADGDKLITILGPDHHGYIGRLQAVVAALLQAEGRVDATPTGEPLTEVDAKLYPTPEARDQARAALAMAREKLEVQIYQLVRFMKDGQPAPMRKRDGNIYALIDLIKEIGEKVRPEGSEDERLQAGRDVARFFYLMRSHDTTFDFDLDLAAKQSDENPVFYVQYAHARICSLLDRAAGEGFEPGTVSDLLTHPAEQALIRKIADLPYEVGRIAEDYGVHRLTTYAIELARMYHAFYDQCRVIQPDQPDLTKARLTLCAATRIGLVGALDLLGVSAPARM